MFRLLYIIQHFFKHFGEPLNSRYGLRSNDGILLSHPNFKTLTTLGDRAFVASAPKLWNDLPSDIRMAKSVDTFKKLLKTHLFSKAFYSQLAWLLIFYTTHDVISIYYLLFYSMYCCNAQLIISPQKLRNITL